MENIEPMNLTEEEESEFQLATQCHICEKAYMTECKMKKIYKGKKLEARIKGEVKVRDQDHLTGKYRGAAHSRCNIQYGWKNYKIPVFFHTLRGYDSHFIIKALNKVQEYQVYSIVRSL